MRNLRQAVSQYLAARIGAGALADVIPELLAALPEDPRLMDIKKQIEGHLINANFHDLFAEHDSTVERATDDLVSAAILIRKHIIDDPEVFQQTLDRLSVNAILKLVYSSERRPDLWDEP